MRERLSKENTKIFISGVIISEVLIKFLKREKPATEAITAMTMLTTLIPFDAKVAEETAKIYVQERRTKSKFGVADAHILAVARIWNAKIITYDNDFRNFSEAIILR